MCILIGDVHQFISHCLITLDPCKLTFGLLLFKKKLYELNTRRKLVAFSAHLKSPKWRKNNNFRFQKLHKMPLLYLLTFYVSFIFSFPRILN